MKMQMRQILYVPPAMPLKSREIDTDRAIICWDCKAEFSLEDSEHGCPKCGSDHIDLNLVLAC